jgi:hypothetical protein
MIRTLAPALILAVLALPAAADDQKTEQWIGSWSGKATSKGCVEPAPKKLNFEVALTHEGGLRSNGDVIFEGWGDLDWKVEGKALALVRDGMSGTLKLSKKTLKLSLRTDGACVVTATLKRTSSGIASCDRVRALATIKAQCAALPSESRGQTLADVEAGWSGWAKLKGKKKTAQGKVCTEQVAALENETKACAAVGGWATGIPECDAYLPVLKRYYTCNGYTPEQVKQSIESTVQYWKSATDPQSKKVYGDQCREGVPQLEASMQSQGCPPP